MPTLVLSSRHTVDSQALWRAAVQSGWHIERVRGLQVPAVDDEDVALYVEALFAAEIATRLGRRLLDPPEDWLVQLPHALRQRDVELTTLAQARAGTEPRFVKPPNDKTFAARVYATGGALPTEYDDDTAVLIAEPVVWTSEYRCFCLNGSVMTASPYLLDGRHAGENDYVSPSAELASARVFAERVLASAPSTPPAIVIDVGLIANRGWAVVEANGAWGSGIYGCDPLEALAVLRHATVRNAS